MTPDAIATDLGQQAFGQVAKPVFEKVNGVPSVWLPYIASSRSVRMRQLENEFGMLEKIMPLTVEALRSVARDVLIVQTSSGEFARTIVRQVPDESDFYHTLSMPPKPSLRLDPKWEKFAENAPKDLVLLYSEFFDGLTSAYRFGGPVPLDWMLDLTRPDFDYSDLDERNEIESIQNQKNIVQILNSGGGGFFFLNLNINQSISPEPEGILLLTGEDSEFSPHKPFWDYLDQWSAIALGG